MAEMGRPKVRRDTATHKIVLQRTVSATIKRRRAKRTRPKTLLTLRGPGGRQPLNGAIVMRHTLKLATGFLGAAALFAGAAALAAGAASAAELKAYAGKSIELKDIHGLIYYAPKGDAFEVATTLDSEGHAFRVVSMLRDGQSAVLSAPGAPGEAAATVEIRREDDRLQVIDHTRPHRAEVTLPNGRRAD